jgi:hypothetical protein
MADALDDLGHRQAEEMVDPASADDPAMQPVKEAGGGVSEGFEEAEVELIESAEHGESTMGDEFPAEEADTAAHGEADEFDVEEEGGP